MIFNFRQIKKMKFRIKNILFVLCFCCLILQVSTGGLCIPACLVFCAANPVMFAGALASGGVAEIGCLPGCGIACSMGLFVPVACFSEHTQLTVKIGNDIATKEIQHIQRNDYVLTLDENGNQIYTKVISNIKSNGKFDYVNIICKGKEGKKELNVTNDHSMIIEYNNQKKIRLAKNLEVGMNLVMENGICEISKIENMILSDKYTLVTEEGTVISSGIFATTICDSEVDENISFQENLKKWKNEHNFISSINDEPK